MPPISTTNRQPVTISSTNHCLSHSLTHTTIRLSTHFWLRLLTFDCQSATKFSTKCLVFPSFPLLFHLVFCFKTAPLYLPSNDSCAAMKHATCQQQKSKVPSSVNNFPSELQRHRTIPLTLPTTTINHSQKSLLLTLKDARHYPTNSSHRHKQIMQEVDAWNEPISPTSLHSTQRPASPFSYKQRSQQPPLSKPAANKQTQHWSIVAVHSTSLSLPHTLSL